MQRIQKKNFRREFIGRRVGFRAGVFHLILKFHTSTLLVLLFIQHLVITVHILLRILLLILMCQCVHSYLMFYMPTLY
jgi:hypothetical protein